MTSRRFESIGGILNRTATDPTPTSEEDDTAPTAAADTTPAAVTKAAPRPPEPPRHRPGANTTAQPESVGQL
jgi:hypothetical protein